MREALVYLIVVSCLSHLQTTLGAPTNQGDNNIVFDTADLTVSYTTPADEQVYVKAFKSSKNDAIIEKSKVDEYGKLKWLSYGHPELVPTAQSSANNSGQMKDYVRLNPKGFSVRVNMLTRQHKELFRSDIKSQYNINAKPEQIVNLELSLFECKLEFSDNDQRILIKGRAKQLNVFPIEVSFDARQKTRERIAFERNMNTSEFPIEFECEIASQGKTVRKNTLQITGSQISQLGLVDKLFGPASSVYVTRDQMSALASDLYTQLDISEQYEIAESRFSSDFVSDFIKQTASVISTEVSLDEALTSLSPYNFREDIKPDIIKQELSKVFKVDSAGSKSRLIVDTKSYEHNKQAMSSKTDVSSEGSFAGVLSAKASVNYAMSRQSDWAKSGASLDDQLRELNAYAESDIQWERNGEMVVPKSIKVSKMIKGQMSKQLSFNRIERDVHEAPFRRSITLKGSTPPSDLATAKVDKPEPYYSGMLLTGSIHIFAGAKKPGLPWLLCDGSAISRKQFSALYEVIGEAYGTGDGLLTFNLPDLRGRVPLGLDPVSGKLGETGGNRSHSITTEEMPSHQHNSGSISLGQSGDHSHSISDPGHTHKYHYLNSFHGGYWGAYFKSGSDGNLGTENSKTGITIDSSGSHSHSVYGNTGSAGSGKAIDLLNPYQIVNYVIYS